MRYGHLIMAIFCAWVLWADNVKKSSPEVMEAFESRSDCMAARLVYVDMNKENSGPLVFTCLPDTVDPRAPKASR